MWLYLLSLLAIKSVHSATIGYPYRSVWTYDPLKASSVHSYLRYLDSNGAAGIVGYNNPQPVYAVRQIKYVDSAPAPALETFAINSSDEILKARETYLRAASLQQYQNLKSDIDSLRAKGKEPSSEKLSKLQVLKKIAFTTDFSLIADLPDIRSTLQDLEASVSSLYREPVKQSSNQQTKVVQSQGEIKTYVGNSNIPLVAIEETPEQKQAREEHLRIYNEQIAHLKHLESEHQKYVKEASTKSNIPHTPNADKPLVEQTDNAKALAALERVQQEHFRLWNEAKLRAEQTVYESGAKGVYETADKQQQQISALTSDQNIYQPKQTILETQNTETQKAQASTELNKQFEQQGLKSATSSLEHTQQLNDQSKLKMEQVQIPGQASQQQHLVDTPEVMRAREEHLRIVNEAILKAQTVPQQVEAVKAKIHAESLSQQIPSDQSKGTSSALNYRAEQSFVEDTPEVKKAREEHLRLVHEANLRAQFVEQQELKYKHESQTPILKSQYEHQQLVFHPESSQNSQKAAEAFKVHEEYLRRVNEATFNAEKSEPIEKPIVFPSLLQPQQQSSESQISGDTPEVQRAREEHIRVFNSIKSHAEQEKAKQNSRIFPNPTSELKPIVDYSNEEERILKLERLREAERLVKEQQLLEADRMREAERLAEEKRQMEDELKRLRLEEEKRLEMERLLEETRLQQEQEELKKLNSGYEEIIIQNEYVDQQPEMAFALRSNVVQPRTQQNSVVVENPNQQYVNNPFLKIGQENRLEHSVNQQNSLLKNFPAQVNSNSYQHNSVTSNSPASSSDNTASGVRYIHSSHHASEGKEQYIKDDKVKHYYHNAASDQPADTAVALLALEKATNDHFRAHELALEHLRLARVQNPALKDCN